MPVLAVAEKNTKNVVCHKLNDIRSLFMAQKKSLLGLKLYIIVTGGSTNDKRADF